MTDEEVAAKFHDCARWAGLLDAGAAIKDMVDSLESMPEVDGLCRALL